MPPASMWILLNASARKLSSVRPPVPRLSGCQDLRRRGQARKLAVKQSRKRTCDACTQMWKS